MYVKSDLSHTTFGQADSRSRKSHKSFGGNNFCEMKMADEVTRKKVIENHRNGIKTEGYLVFHNKENDSFIIRKERSRNQTPKETPRKDSPSKDSPKKDSQKQKLSNIL